MKKDIQKSWNYTFATDTGDDCYLGSNLIDSHRCIGSIRRITRAFVAPEVSLFCVCHRAWHEIGRNGCAREFRSFAAVLIFSAADVLPARLRSRVRARLLRVYTSPFYSYFTTCRNLHSTCAPIYNTYVNPSEKITICINISTVRRVMHIFWKYNRSSRSGNLLSPNDGASSL